MSFVKERIYYKTSVKILQELFVNLEWWHMVIILALRRLRNQDQFKARLDYKDLSQKYKTQQKRIFCVYVSLKYCTS